MPRYFTHLIDETDALLDPHGVFRSADTVEAATLDQARECMAGDVKEGHLDLGYRLDVEDESGEVVHSLEFADAVEILREPDANDCDVATTQTLGDPFWTKSQGSRNT